MEMYNHVDPSEQYDRVLALEEPSNELKVSLQDRGIDILIGHRIITTKSMEMALRAIDTKCFYSEDFFVNNIRKFGNNDFIRNSETCIAIHLLNNLQLRRGMSFLCIACDTGFINAVAGLLLGPKGINHGLNIDRRRVQQARRNVDEFSSNSDLVSQFGFCVPEIEVSNVMTLDYNKYDRIICLRESPYGNLAKTLQSLKMGGKAVLVYKNRWRLGVRCSSSFYSCRVIDRVNLFDEDLLQTPREDDIPRLPKLAPPKLMNMCRNLIRSVAKQEVVSEYGLPETRPSLIEYLRPIRRSPRMRNVIIHRVAPEIRGLRFRYLRAGTRFEQNVIYRYERDLKKYMKWKKDNDIPIGNYMRERLNQIPVPTPVKKFLNYDVKRLPKFED